MTPEEKKNYEEQIMTLMGNHEKYICDAKAVVLYEKDRFYVTISRMYEYIEFEGMSQLVAYHKIMEILGCNDGREIDRDYYGGCDTCDWGSKYSINLEFWK